MKTLIYRALDLMQPLGLCWLLLTAWVALAWCKRRPGKALPTLAWLVLSLATCTPLPSWLMAGLESRHAPVTIGALPQADMIVCLGGGAEPSFIEPTGIHLKGAADRLSTALALALRKKAAALVLGGGGYSQDGEDHSEADAFVQHLSRLGEMPVEVVSLGLCSDTHDEAVKCAALARERGWRSVLLVTSASHMARSFATFEKAGLEVIAVPCAYESSFHRVGDMRWLHLPHAGSFSIFASWFHEVIGMAAYRWRGWM
ncbi:MAG TPA: YdcF family protein [Prosthecobacter sp.]|nr:YdcF family protein [Prosthecobacter sp.]HRK14832.1 YdcF family protein [Prosthecobacter sp.]